MVINSKRNYYHQGNNSLGSTGNGGVTSHVFLVEQPWAYVLNKISVSRLCPRLAISYSGAETPVPRGPENKGWGMRLGAADGLSQVDSDCQLQPGGNDPREAMTFNF